MSKKRKQSSRKRMSRRLKSGRQKQSPGAYLTMNPNRETVQVYNRAARRGFAAQKRRHAKRFAPAPVTGAVEVTR